MHNGLWFDPRSLEQRVTPITWGRGLAVYRNQQVLDLEINPLGPSWEVLGEVQGSEREPYEVTVALGLAEDGSVQHWKSRCTCPASLQCKHGVALLIKAAYKGLALLGQDLGEPRQARTSFTPTPADLEAARAQAQARHEEATRRLTESQLLQWLHDVDQAGGKLPQARPDGAPERYLYLLKIINSQTQRPQLQMQATLSAPRVTGGGWTKPRPLRSQPYAGQPAYDQASAADREVLQLLYAMAGGSGVYSAYSSSAQAQPAGQAGQVALQQAASTGRLFADDGKGAPGAAVQWGPAQALVWQWQEVEASGNGTPGWVLRAQLNNEAGNARLCLNNPPLYLDAERGLCGPVVSPGLEAAQIPVLLRAPPMPVHALKKHQVQLAQTLGTVPLPPVVQDFSVLDGGTPRTCLHLSPCPAALVAQRGLVQAQLLFDYQGIRGWWVGQGMSVLVDAPQGRVLLKRDGEAELDAMARLLHTGLRAVSGGIYGLPGHASQQLWLQWADNDYAELRQAGFDVSLDPALQGWITRADALQVQLQPQGDDDATSPWFSLSLGIEVNGRRHNILPLLPSLIAAAANSPPDPHTGQPVMPPFVYLPDNSSGTRQGFIRLPTDTLKPWMAALLELVGERTHDFTGDTLRLSRVDAMRTTASLGEGAVWDGAAHLHEMVQRLSGRAEMPEVPAPKSVNATLRAYQQQGLNWLQFLRENHLGGILADDMGLGKTLQTLAHIQVEKDAGRLTHPALIIAPVSLMGNWRQEAARFCPELRALVIHGKDRHEVADAMGEHDIVIAPYSLLHRDRERWLQTRWHLVVLDEAQNIKNASTHAAQVVGELQTTHRLCLSGTPMENHLGEIWSLFHFLMPGFLGSQKRFGELFRTPIEKQGDGERLAQLRARVTPFMLRRTKSLVAAELPPKVETIQRVVLTGKQADLYETIRLGMEKAVREALSTKGLAKSQITILDALLKLRQVCCDPQLLKLPAAKKVTTSAKLEHLMTLLPDMVAQGRRILLFSQFTTMLTLIEAELKKHHIPWVKLTGASQNRDALIGQFTRGDVPVFLISLKAGGVGLNLPQADTVIHYDPWWNPAAEAQATDRAHRIGQTQTVFVHKLVAQDTIEERILALQERKAALADSMYSGAAGRKQPLFTEDDLAELLRPLAG